VLLAATQQRQGPANATLFGIANFIIDGIKLFSKQTGNTSGFTGAIMAVGILFSIPLLIDSSICRSTFGSLFCVLVLAFMSLASILEIVCFLALSSQQNHFVQLASMRLFEVMCLVEIVYGLVVLVLGLTGSLLPVSGLSAVNVALTGQLMLLLFVFWLVANEKVPFDIVEAESELIDGVSVDLPGAVFSMVYAGEAMIVWVSLKFFVPADLGFLWLTLALFCILVYIGRILVARILLVDLENAMLSTGLLITGFLITIL